MERVVIKHVIELQASLLLVVNTGTLTLIRDVETTVAVMDNRLDSGYSIVITITA